MTQQQIRDHIENRAMQPWQWCVVALGVLINMLDGFDLLATSLVAPALARELTLSQEDVGILLSSDALGMAFGAFVLSSSADLWGRRTAIMINLCLMSVGMLVSSSTRSTDVLIAMRFLTGMGVGAMASCVGTLIFEYSSLKHRNLAMGFVTIGYTVGAVVGNLFAKQFLAAGYNWTALFALGGVLTFLLIPMTFLLVPESLDFLISKPRANTLVQVNRVMHHLKLSALSTLPAPTAKMAKSSVFDPLRQPILPRQLLMGVSYFLYMMSGYFFLKWNNKLTTDAGFADAAGLNISLYTSIGGIIGGIVIGYLSSKLSFRATATVTMVIMGITIAVFGGAAHSLLLTKVCAFIIGFCVFGAAVVIYVTAAATFPARVRATGIGLSMGAGRLGSFFGPFVAGQMLGDTLDLGRVTTCVLLAIPVLLSTLVLMKVPLKPLSGE